MGRKIEEMIASLCNSFVLLPPTSKKVIDLAKSAKITRSQSPDSIGPLIARRTIA